jgi:23S rRNA (adenine1618-N6)-methyltransferase
VHPAKTPAPKPGHHPRNPHRAGYDFPTLLRGSPELSAFLRISPGGTQTIDFADPAAVLALNAALLKSHYGVQFWNVPPGYLCPPVPGRADYVHHLADLLAGGGPAPRGAAVRILDIGVGANCIYPILGSSAYGWSFVGTDIDPAAVAAARAILARNPALRSRVEIRLQPRRDAIFRGAIEPAETFAATMCNPPFHASAAAAAVGTLRKLRNLHGGKANAPARNFGGRSHELWCDGGEVAFVRRMIAESATRPGLCRWFTTLVSKRESLPPIERALRFVAPREVKTIELAQGQKKSRIVAWRFATG